METEQALQAGALEETTITAKAWPAWATTDYSVADRLADSRATCGKRGDVTAMWPLGFGDCGGDRQPSAGSTLRPRADARPMQASRHVRPTAGNLGRKKPLGRRRGRGKRGP